MSGSLGPTEITPLPDGGEWLTSSTWSRNPITEVTPLPDGGEWLTVKWPSGSRLVVGMVLGKKPGLYFSG